MFNRTGQLVCTMTLECYFGGKERLASGQRSGRPQRDRQRRPPVQYPGVPAAARAGGADVGEAIEERPQAHLALGAGQRRAQAEVPAAGERQMLAGVVAFDVERVRDRRRRPDHGWPRRGR